MVTSSVTSRILLPKNQKKTLCSAVDPYRSWLLEYHNGKRNIFWTGFDKIVNMLNNVGVDC